jgi:PII-like signaling protein
MLQYKLIEIFTGEGARWQGRPLNEAMVEFVRDLNIAARCMVTRAIDGCYESGEIATRRLEVLSYNMPLRITIVMPVSELDRVLSRIEEMVTDGIVAVRELDVVSHKTQQLLIPKHTRVRDIMTHSPRMVTPATSLAEVLQVLLCSVFTGLPVVDESNRPIGIITQGDLIYRAGVPMRLARVSDLL